MVRDILVFVSGALVGAGAAYFGFKKYYDNKLADSKEAFEDRISYYEKMLHPVTEDTTQTGQYSEDSPNNNSNGTALPPKVNITYTDYAFPYSSTGITNSESSEDPTVPLKSSEKYKNFDGALKIGMISEEEFQQSDFNCAEYAWTRDGKLIDERYNIIEHPERSIGYDTLEYIQEHPDIEEFYARNEHIELDYVITREDYTAEEHIDTFDPGRVFRD